MSEPQEQAKTAGAASDLTVRLERSLSEDEEWLFDFADLTLMSEDRETIMQMMRRKVKEAELVEREACAKVCEHTGWGRNPDVNPMAGNICAGAIRMRSNAEITGG